jgi:hypothetical protein
MLVLKKDTRIFFIDECKKYLTWNSALSYKKFKIFQINLKKNMKYIVRYGNPTACNFCLGFAKKKNH